MQLWESQQVIQDKSKSSTVEGPAIHSSLSSEAGTLRKNSSLKQSARFIVYNTQRIVSIYYLIIIYLHHIDI